MTRPGVGAAQGVGDVWFADRERADHDVVGAGSQGHLDGGAVAQAAADLDLDAEAVGCFDQGLDQRGLDGVASEGAVEVDDVDAGGAGADELAELGEWVGGVDGGARGVALGEADSLTAEQVDRGDRQQGGEGRGVSHVPQPLGDRPGPGGAHPRPPRMKLRRKRSPDHCDFSGWNWQPNTLPRHTVAGNSMRP